MSPRDRSFFATTRSATERVSEEGASCVSYLCWHPPVDGLLCPQPVSTSVKSLGLATPPLHFLGVSHSIESVIQEEDTVMPSMRGAFRVTALLIALFALTCLAGELG